MPILEILKEPAVFVIVLRDYKDPESSSSYTTHAMDVGALTPSLGIRRTRKVNEFYERVSVLVCIRLYSSGRCGL
jgi:hypothetical protein